MSEGPSPRNGPWKKLVNSPGFPASRATECDDSGATGLIGAGGVVNGGSFGGEADFMLEGSQGAAACTPELPGRLGEGVGRTGGSGVLDFASESKSRNSCVIWPGGACSGSFGVMGGANGCATAGTLVSLFNA